METKIFKNYTQPHSLEGIQIGGKINKEKKKGNNQDCDNNHKSESSENTKTHINKDQQKSSMSKSRRKSNEILSIVTPTTSYAQVMLSISIMFSGNSHIWLLIYYINMCYINYL